MLADRTSLPWSRASSITNCDRCRIVIYWQAGRNVWQNPSEWKINIQHFEMKNNSTRRCGTALSHVNMGEWKN